MLNEIFTSGRPIVFGHRGFSEAAPENTMASFSMCRENGIPGIELDVHLCRTGEIVIIHDFSTKRLTGVDLVVEETSFDELRQLDFGLHKGEEFKGQRIMTLDELFTEFGDCFIYDVELKSNEKFKDTGLADKVWDCIVSHKLETNVLASSFNPFTLRRFNKVSGKSIPSADIFSAAGGTPKILEHGFGRKVSLSSYQKPDFSQITASFMKQRKEKEGYPVVAWTVNTKEEADRLLSLGVDGLIGNNPLLLAQAVSFARA